MHKIDWDKPIFGADGKSRTQKDIEGFFIELFSPKISNNLANLITDIQADPSLIVFADYVEFIRRHIDDILIAKPNILDGYGKLWDILKTKCVRNGLSAQFNEFSGKLLNKFGYEDFREALLNKIAVVINVKTCMYCNQHYTIAVGRNPGRDGGISLHGSKAFLQFDHFFSKKKYPILSMSLYNLIPSCPFCNQRKSITDLPLRLHPYTVNLSDKFHFKIKNLSSYVNPINPSNDLLEVEIDTHGDSELKDFLDQIGLTKRYARHLDIVQELECALYFSRYYNENFTIISQEFTSHLKKPSILS
ncbi:MAG: hypothetical protein NC453_13530 [Muribaculum sp.]|nr:hypothetical protein [Muribaculum sp.]